MQKSFHYSFVLQFQQNAIKTIKRIEFKILKIIKRIEIETLKISKFIFVVVDIEYFDAIFVCDIQKFDLYHETTSFYQHLQNIRINYREKKLFSLLFDCFRNFNFVWYKKQNENDIVKKNLSE